jgi:DNA-binding MarR family transcriptional regulator
MEEKLERIHRLYRNARAAFSSFDEKLFAELSPKEIEERIETLRINSPNGLEYY